MLCHPCILGGPQRQVRRAKSEVVPHKGEQNQKWLPHPCLLRGSKVGRNATSPLRSRGPQQRGTKSQVDASPLPSRGPKRGRKCYVTPTSSGIPNKGEQNHKWLPHPCLLGAQRRAEMLCHPCILGGAQRQARGENQKWPFGVFGVHSRRHSKNIYCLNIFLFFFTLA